MTSEDIQKKLTSEAFWKNRITKQGVTTKQPKPFDSVEYAEKWLKKLDQNHIPTSTGKSWMYNDALNPITSGRRPGSTDDGYDRMRDFGYVQTGYNREYAGYSRKRKQRR